MQIINFLCADEHTRDLSSFAQRIFGTLGVTDGMERDSSYYLEERYFLGKIDGGRLKIALSDIEEFDDLSYWLSVEIEADSNVVTYMDMFIKKVLSMGIRIAKIEYLGKKNMLRVDY
jgi:hypothetical protein